MFPFTFRDRFYSFILEYSIQSSSKLELRSLVILAIKLDRRTTWCSRREARACQRLTTSRDTFGTFLNAPLSERKKKRSFAKFTLVYTDDKQKFGSDLDRSV